MRLPGANLRNLAYVLAVADAGSLVAAAEKVRISPSAISAAIKAQEAELGYALFVRRPAQRLRLTPLGREFVGNARVFMEHCEGFMDAARGLRASLTGQVAVGCFSSIAPMVIPPVVARLRKAHPDLAMSLTEGDHAALVAALESGDVELALTYDFVRERSLDYEPVFAVRHYVLIASTHKLARRSVISLKALAAEELVAIDLPSIRDYLVSLFAAMGLRPRLWQPSRSIAMPQAMVGHGLGYSVAFLRTRTATGPGAVPGLRCVPLADDVPTHHVAIAVPRRATLTRRARAFIDACHDVLGRRGLQRRFQVGL